METRQAPTQEISELRQAVADLQASVPELTRQNRLAARRANLWRFLALGAVTAAVLGPVAADSWESNSTEIFARLTALEQKMAPFIITGGKDQGWQVTLNKANLHIRNGRAPPTATRRIPTTWTWRPPTVSET